MAFGVPIFSEGFGILPIKKRKPFHIWCRKFCNCTDFKSTYLHTKSLYISRAVLNFQAKNYGFLTSILIQLFITGSTIFKKTNKKHFAGKNIKIALKSSRLYGPVRNSYYCQPAQSCFLLNYISVISSMFINKFVQKCQYYYTLSRPGDCTIVFRGKIVFMSTSTIVFTK